jgi:hypothetical protein
MRTTGTRTPRRILLCAAFMCIPLFGVPASAAALAYASSAAPLSVSAYGSTTRSYGNWTATSGNDVRSYLTSSYYKFTDADDHTAYVRLYSHSSHATPGWGVGRETSHDNVISSSWTAFRTRPSVTLSVSPRAVTITSHTAACLDIPIRPDECGQYKALSLNL